MEKELTGNRRVAIRDFYGPGANIYADELGWQKPKYQSWSIIWRFSESNAPYI